MKRLICFPADCYASYLSYGVISGNFEFSNLRLIFFLSSVTCPNSGRSNTVFLFSFPYSNNTKILNLSSTKSRKANFRYVYGFPKPIVKKNK